MIEIRIPTPSKDKIKLLEQSERCDCNLAWGNFIYIEVFKKDLIRLKKFLIYNSIVEPGNIEEIQSGNWPTLEKTSLMEEYLKKNNIDYTVSVYIKLPKKQFTEFVNWQTENGFEEK
ncbi:MAG TPA: hypothetical protein VN368_01570 [Candidatus Methylomirabilis sp.]|nr:hypothetical protein [Candidatus Methylomirabilis sp.]